MTKNLRLPRLADQAGFAMPVVVAVSALLILVATAAVTSGLTATTSANEDRQVKLARQAADSGMEMALFHLNRIAAGETLPCVSRDASGNYAMANYAAGNQWCAPVTETLADGSTMSYTISAEAPQANTNPEQVVRKIVATGTYLGEQRRVYTELLAARGVINGGVYGITARDQIIFENFAKAGGPDDTVHVRTNGDIILKNNAQICGNATPGPGKTVTTERDDNVCEGFSTAPAATPLPPETFYDYGPEHDAAWITNDNSRLGCTPAGPLKDACTHASGITWDAEKRELIVGNNATLTLSGSVYSLCRLNLKNGSRVYIAPRPSGSPIRFYFNSPDKCFGQTENIMIENGWGITNNNTDPTSLQFFVRGSTSETTKVNIKNNAVGAAATPMLIHAPNSEILLENNAGMFGTLVGKTVHLKNSALIASDPDPDDDDQSAALVYQPTGHRECSPVAPGEPDSGC
jgi:type II secretory pathway pseudopilin PulG